VTHSSNNAQGDAAPVKKVGIIGGGQLGLLLCQAGRRIGLHTTVLTDDATSPAVHSADDVLVAQLDDSAAVTTLIQQCDVVTFELEAIPDVTLDKLQTAIDQALVMTHPSVEVMTCIKDKGLQKTWLSDARLPTLPFALIDAKTQADSGGVGGIDLPLVQKARQGGYDGKGVQILRTAEELEELWPVPSVIEPALHNCVEVAVVVARDVDGMISAYPPVTMEFDPQLNAVSTVISPGLLAPEVQKSCRTIASEAVNALGSVGVFAVELFLTQDGELYINEISPRVHNSGHLTIDGFAHDQFEQHMRAVSGHPVAAIESRAPAAVMLNLLYDDSMVAAHTGAPYALALDEHVTLHWYGKPEARPGRKMGHINALGDSTEAALERARAGLAKIQSGDLNPPKAETQAVAS